MFFCNGELFKKIGIRLCCYLASSYLTTTRDFIDISDLTYRKMEIGKVVTQPVKIVRTLDPFKLEI